ncbi:MAG: Ig-like domain-containing protein [Desulfuromonadales bacterium]|nr:Ig-like domain-containing protein [Desulfuromonadales bacterium]
MSVFISILSGCGGGGGGVWSEPVTTSSVIVTSTDPANAETGVFLNTKISATFSGAVDPATITTTNFIVTQGTTVVQGTVAFTPITAVFSPLTNLIPLTEYTVTITTGVKDSAGKALANNYVFKFTTGTTLDTTAPTVTATVNANNAIGVPTNTKVGATFSEAMNSTTFTATTFTLTQGATPVPGTVTSSGVNATFQPTNTLLPNTLYTATITTGAKDLAGNGLVTPYVWRWTTGGPDTTPPTVIATINANGATGVPINTKAGATFSEAMDLLTISTATFILKQGTTNVPGAVTYSGVNAVYTPAVNLLPNTVYNATITTGAKDLAGNALASNFVWSWTTGAALDTTPPKVTLESPANLATGVAINSVVRATFDKAMNPLTITNQTFTVTFGTTPVTAVTGLVTYDALTRIATFTPSSNLLSNTTYTATVTIGAKDQAGNALASGLVPNPWTFTTLNTGSGLAPGAVPLASASTYGIMATSAITSTGNTVINGDVSLDPGTSMTGFPPGTVNGSIHINDSFSAQARLDLLAAFNFATTLPPGTTVSAGADLGALNPGGVLPPGTYTSGSTMLVSTPLTLDAGGNANAVWVFQIGSSLTTGASVSLANGAQAKNVFWVPTQDATIGVGTIFYGTIVSGRNVTAVTGATINGRILAGAINAGTIALQNATVNVPAP